MLERTAGLHPAAVWDCRGSGCPAGLVFPAGLAAVGLNGVQPTGHGLFVLTICALLHSCPSVCSPMAWLQWTPATPSSWSSASQRACGPACKRWRWQGEIVAWLVGSILPETSWRMGSLAADTSGRAGTGAGRVLGWLTHSGRARGAGSLFPCAHPAAAMLCLAMPQARLGFAADGPPAGDDQAGAVCCASFRMEYNVFCLFLKHALFARNLRGNQQGTHPRPCTLGLQAREGNLPAGAPAALHTASSCGLQQRSMPPFSIPHSLVQAQEGDDKLGRQLRGADGATLHLVESARAQVGTIQRFQSSASWPKNVAIVFACVNLRFKCFVATSLLPSHLPPPHPQLRMHSKIQKGTAAELERRLENTARLAGKVFGRHWTAAGCGAKNVTPLRSSRFSSCLLLLTSRPADPSPAQSDASVPTPPLPRSQPRRRLCVAAAGGVCRQGWCLPRGPARTSGGL